MYWIVPSSSPAVVSGEIGLIPLIVFAAESRGAAAPSDAIPASAAFARPKSISFAPPFVSMMLPGFKSR